MSDQRGRADRCVLLFLAVLVVVAPWPLGSRLPWASMLLAGAVILVTALWSAKAVIDQKALVSSPLFPPALAFLGWAGLQWLLGWTIYADATAYEWVRYGSYACVMFLTVQLARETKHGVFLVRTLVLVTLVVGCFGLVQALTWNGQLYWLYEPPYSGIRFGPFNNRNYFAGYMLVGLGLAFAATALKRTPRRWWWFLAAATGVGIVSVFVSLSRAGIITLLVELGAVALLARRGRQEGERDESQAVENREHRRGPFTVSRVAAAVGILLVLVVALAAVGQLDRVMARLETVAGIGEEAPLGGRWLRWQESLPMVSERPLAGFGLNTYGWAYARFNGRAGFSMHAHNEYLEMIIETGIVGGIICFWFLVVLFRAGSRRLSENGATVEQRVIRIGSMAAWGAILLYSMTDFPTIIPAINYSLAILAALATTQFE